jgi:hypothetical protein
MSQNATKMAKKMPQNGSKMPQNGLKKT